jgi:hypothetical protein
MTTARLSIICPEVAEKDVCVLSPPGELRPSHVEPKGQQLPYAINTQLTLLGSWTIARLVPTASVGSWHTAGAAVSLTRVSACSYVGVGPARNSDAGG